MRRNVLALSLAAMIGGLGFAGAASGGPFDRVPATHYEPPRGRPRGTSNGGVNRGMTQARVKRAAVKARNVKRHRAACRG
jgi:hypothetical protein